MGLEDFEYINGYENLYMINKLGEIFSCKSNKKLKPIIKNTGYCSVNLYKDGKKSNKFIHILVAQQFLNKKDSNMVVNHKNLNKADNTLENLEYVTQKENIYHSKLNGRQRREKGSENINSKKVLQFDLNNNFIRQWDCVMDIERELGIKSNYVSNCALGKCKKSQGFIWRYLEGRDDLSD